jgi:hypothetical protein
MFRHTALVLVFALVSAGIVVRAQPAPAATEYQVKAAYLYNFGRFIEWPARPTSPSSDDFLVCVLGQDPFGDTLDHAIAGANIGTRHVLARRIAKPDETGGCQILFISASEERQLAPIVNAVSKSAVLTVSDIPNFTRRGGMIQFVTEGNRVRFEINLTPADAAGLAVSSDLLKVAVGVRRYGRPGA